eukprot:7919422-Heterocapsa_arctica.AAC.1
MATDFIYVGVLFQLARLISTGLLKIDAKPGRREALLDEVAWFRSRDWMTPSEAATLRGRLGFLGSQLMGRIIR